MNYPIWGVRPRPFSSAALLATVDDLADGLMAAANVDSKTKTKAQKVTFPAMAGQRYVCLSAASDVFLNIYYWFLRGHFIYIGIGQYYDKNLFTSFGSHGAGVKRFGTQRRRPATT